MIRLGNATIVFLVRRNPQSLSVGGGQVSFPRVVIMLFNGDAFGGWPKHVTAKSVVPGGGNIVVGLLPSAIQAVMVGTNWMKAVGVAMCSHVAEFLHLGASALAIACSPPGVWVLVFIVCQLCGHGSNGGGEFLDFRLHNQQLFLRLHIGGDVGR